MKDLNEALKEGRAVLGSKETISALLTKEPSKVFIASNCPARERDAMVYYSALAGVPLEAVKENSMELGSLCGKPFNVSAASIL